MNLFSSSPRKLALVVGGIALLSIGMVVLVLSLISSPASSPETKAQLALASQTYIVGTITGKAPHTIIVDAQVPDLSVPLTKQGDIFVPTLKTVSFTVTYTAATHFTGALTEGAVVKAESATPIEGTTFTATSLITETP